MDRKAVYLLATVCTCSIVTSGSFTIWTHCIAIAWESPGDSHNLFLLHRHYVSCCNPKRLTLRSHDNCKKLLNFLKVPLNRLLTPWAHNLMSSKLVASQIVMLQQPHLPREVDQKLGHKSPSVQATLNLSMTLYHLIKARAKQCPTTLWKEDQGMILLENGKERLVSRDKTKVMIAHDHAQYITVWQDKLRIHRLILY